MSMNFDQIDLNSDAVPAEQGHDVSGVDTCGSKTLINPVNVKGQTRESVDGNVGGVTGEKVSLDEKIWGNEAETGAVSVAEMRMEDGDVAESSRSVLGDGSHLGDAGSSGLVPGIVDVEVKLASGSDFQDQRDCDRVEVEVVSHGNEVHEMEIDEAKTSKVEINGDDVIDERIYGRSDNNGSRRDSNITAAKIEKAAISKLEVGVGDLVWGKVRSHPWWPGQIIDPSTCSDQAKKYFKRDGYLIAYFGDQTFAWNDESMIKPFRSHFSQMEKQSNTEDFSYAVECALDEVARRVEYGLACPCMPNYSKIKTQSIINAGVREEYSRKDGGDRFSTADTFEPETFVEYVKAFGQLPLGGVERLELLSVEAQLLAFNHWRGYSEPPQLQILGAILESDTEVPSFEEVTDDSEDSNASENEVSEVKMVDFVLPGKGKSKSQYSLSKKRKHFFGLGDHSVKKEKSLADLMAERRSSLPDGKSGLVGKGKKKSICVPCGKKRKGVDSSDPSAVEHSKSSSTSGVDINRNQPESCSTSGVDSNYSQLKKTYRVGDSILRVASQMNGQAPILKSDKGTSKKLSAQSESKDKSICVKSQAKKLFSMEDSSTEDMVLRLSLAAKDPMKGFSSFEPMTSFFTAFRNSVCPDHLSEQQLTEPIMERRLDDDSEKESVKFETETDVSEPIKDSYLADTVIQSNPGELSSLTNEKETAEILPNNAIGKDPTAEPESVVQCGTNLDTEQHSDVESPDMEALDTAYDLEEDSDFDSTPTALILKFTNLDSVPSKTNLNGIFSRFGLLMESETEVLKKSSRAKVVFRKQADAEAAFSSAGKYRIFGPSLVSYRLKYMPSMQSRKDAANAT
ncbi:hypothetical protein K2173_001893 [Erythroxylum novogranatense]|uniref:PWWP domain-containing protein n=1 Tax=Erythroxylum novogranatense TaxID=1862640 RepID=A0AAV8SPM8_9ROSI|nr:hypothetical protein K2173_001893 [Erythroxylum novogranatense]